MRTAMLAAALTAQLGCEGFLEGSTDGFEGNAFDPTTCEPCEEQTNDPPPGTVDGYHVSCNATGLCIDYWVPTAGEADRIKDQCGAAGAQPGDAHCERGDHVCKHTDGDSCSLTHTYGSFPEHDEECTRVRDDRGGTPGTVGGSCT